jgi:hypothetical protein
MNRFIALTLAFCMSVPQAGANSVDSVATLKHRMPIPQSPRQLLANDKELDSNVIDEHDIEQAHSRLDATVNDVLLNQVADRLSSLLFVEERPICEVNTFQEILKTLRESDPSLSSQSLESVLVLLREKDMIDDVILLPLIHFLPAYLELESTLPSPQSPPLHAPATPPEPTLAPAHLADEPAERKQAIDAFQKLDHKCSSDVFMSAATYVTTLHKLKYHKKDFLDLVDNALTWQVINPLEAAWLRSLAENHFEKSPFTLSKAAMTMKYTKNADLISEKGHGKSSFSTKVKKKTHGNSYRVNLYKNFNWNEIASLESIGADWILKSAPTSTAYVTFTYLDQDGNPTNSTEKLSPLSTVDTANSLFRAHMKSEMDRTTVEIGKKAEVEDVVAALIETGWLAGDDVEAVLKMKEMWDPHVSTMNKILTAAQKYGSAALILVPPPFSTLVSITLILLETKVFPDHSKDAKAKDDGNEQL